MAWLGRFRRPPASLFSPTPWSLPRLVLLPARDHHSASATRRRNPSWGAELSVRHLRDGLTHKRIDRDAAIADPPPKKPARARA